MEKKPAEVIPDPSYWKARGEATMGSIYFRSPVQTVYTRDPDGHLVMLEPENKKA